MTSTTATNNATEAPTDAVVDSPSPYDAQDDYGTALHGCPDPQDYVGYDDCGALP